MHFCMAAVDVAVAEGEEAEAARAAVAARG
jgi:hypothetical protein